MRLRAEFRRQVGVGANFFDGAQPARQAQVLSAVDIAHASLTDDGRQPVAIAQDGSVRMRRAALPADHKRERNARGVDHWTITHSIHYNANRGSLLETGLARIVTMDDRPVLVVSEGELAGQRWAIAEDEVVVGRGSDSDIVLPERQVSRHHLKIHYRDGRYMLEDLESKNGTFLNGQPVHGTVLLQDGDEIQIALCVRMLFVGTDATVPLSFDMPRVDGANLRLDEDRRTVLIKGQELDPPLSLAQFRLLQMLYDAEGAVCGRDEIIEAVWPGTGGLGVSEQAIDALVRRLRDRLAELDDYNYIVTVRGHGFRLANR